MTTDYTVGRVAKLAGVSVRTLHHYDQIGLVSPSGRTAAGYRVYAAGDISRLHQVLTYRRLGFGLEQIASLIDDPDVDAVAHLHRQRALLLAQRGDIDAVVAAIDKQLEARVTGMQLTPEEQLEVFGTDKVGGQWADEARERWGESAAYQESQRRAATYRKADWARLKAESDDALRAFASTMRDRVPPASPAAQALAEQHRQFIDRWFYECGHETHRGLAEMYVNDPQFTQTFDAVAPGLAQYVHDAILANSDANA